MNTENINNPINSITTKVQRLNYLDSLKGFAALLVAVGHSMRRFVDTFGIESLEKITGVIYMFHMPLFIVISGWVFEMNYKRNGEIIKPKYKTAILNLVIMYLVYDGVFIILKAIIGGFERQVSFTDLLLMPIKFTGEMWFFYVLILLYLIFRFSIFENSKYIPLILIILFIISAFVSPLILDRYIFAIKDTTFLALFFYYGMLCDIKYKLTTNKIFNIVLIVASIILVVIYCAFNIELSLIPMAETIAALGLSIGCIILFKEVNFLGNSKILSFLGRHAIEIYVIHLYVTEVLWRIYLKLGIDAMIPCIIIVTTVSVTVSVVIGIILEKIHLYNLFFKPYKYFRDRFSMNHLQENNHE